MKKLFTYLFSSMVCVACSDSNQLEEKIAQIPMQVPTIRFDSLFYFTPFEELSKVEAQYPYLFPTPSTDTLWQNKKQDTLQAELYGEVFKAFPSLEKEQAQMKSLYQHIKYYFPSFSPPKLIALVSEVDYLHKVIYSDSLLLIGIDNYLGPQHHFYEGFQQYIKPEFDRQYIRNDAAQAIAQAMVPPTRSNVFLDRMIYHGKILYLSALFLGNTHTDEYLLKYDTDKFQWAKANESEIWRYFIEKELLYSTDKKTLSRFIDPAPFSKFYMEFDNQSPGGIGKYIGLQIVRAYMQQHPNAILTMLKEPAAELFKKSNYKPQK